MPITSRSWKESIMVKPRSSAGVSQIQRLLKVAAVHDRFDALS